LIARLNEDQLKRFAAAGDIEVFRPGEDIVVAGTLGDALYLILSGSAQVFGDAKASGRALAKLGAGEFFGEMSLIEPAPRSATVRALEACELLRVPNFAMANLMQDDPAAMNLMLTQIVRVLSRRLRSTNQLVGSVKELADFLSGSLV
jgi:CRP-like cAMP-binding protein